MVLGWSQDYTWKYIGGNIVCWRLNLEFYARQEHTPRHLFYVLDLSLYWLNFLPVFQDIKSIMTSKKTRDLKIFFTFWSICLGVLTHTCVCTHTNIQVWKRE